MRKGGAVRGLDFPIEQQARTGYVPPRECNLIWIRMVLCRRHGFLSGLSPWKPTVRPNRNVVQVSCCDATSSLPDGQADVHTHLLWDAVGHFSTIILKRIEALFR
jgi:hypothetical protein